MIAFSHNGSDGVGGVRGVLGGAVGTSFDECAIWRDRSRKGIIISVRDLINIDCIWRNNNNRIRDFVFGNQFLDSACYIDLGKSNAIT